MASNPNRLIAPGEDLQLTRSRQFVSRGGEKLAAALSAFSVDVKGRTAIDVGSSTGGFTDCLLKLGVRSVVAVDTGTHQLHESLRDDPRVSVRESTDIRDAAADIEPADLVVVDVSFTSVSRLAGAVVGCARAGGDLIALVKPQFEATRGESDRGGGVINDPAVWSRVLREANAALATAGATIMGVMVSPLKGSSGNVEFLVHARKTGDS